MTRVLSGVILAAAAVAAILFLPFIGLRVLACAVSGLAANEYLRITDDGCFHIPRPISELIHQYLLCDRNRRTEEAIERTRTTSFRLGTACFADSCKAEQQKQQPPPTTHF